MTATTPATPAAPTGASFKAVVWLSIPQILATLAISTGAGFESFFAFRGLAILFGWNPEHAWIVWPLVELFLLVGSLEDALRQMDGATKKQRRIARFVSYGALIVTLGANVGYRVLTLILPVHEGRLVPGETLEFHVWQVVMIGVFASIIPIAQLLSLHFLAGRLKRLAEYRNRSRSAIGSEPEEKRPRLGSLARRIVEQKLEQKLGAIAEPPASGGQPVPPNAPNATPDDDRTDPPSGDSSDRRSDPETDRGDGPTDRRSEPETDRGDSRTDRRTDRRSGGRTDRRSRWGGDGRSANGTDGGSSDRDEASGDRSSQLREKAYREYAAAIDRGNGFEPTAGTIAAKIKLSEPRVRNIRADWRKRYAAEHLSGDRRPIGDLPPAIAKVLDGARVHGEASGQDDPGAVIDDRPDEDGSSDRAESPAVDAADDAVIDDESEPRSVPAPRPPLRVVPPAGAGDDDLDVALVDREPATATA
ncbi:hypothetical protein OOJ91_33995 [Micromonospora lupini]|uniref:hypothetical protein n=1 Tax=Micromonospora lupini TaxID=285679 RepID=UPI00224E441F|nr:hypothetical protein [Micromonospora lupini]MCX5070861.1 hypothetical protein [Micromonospora lupini]